MNEFTKEELEDIKYALDEYSNFEEEKRVSPLIYKIKSMIDNYDHQHKYKETKESFLVTDYRCDICGEKLND